MMSYRDPERGYKGITYGAGAMAVLGIGFALKMCTGFVGGLPPTTPASAEQAMLEDPKNGAMFATIKRTYPREFEGLKNEIARRGAEFKGNSNIAAGVRSFLLDAMKRHLPELAQASHPALAAYRRSEIAVAEGLQTGNLAQCATYFRSGVVNTPESSQATTAAVSDFQIKAWEAEAAGRDSPAGRKVTRPDQTVINMLGSITVKAGIPLTDFDGALNGAPMADATQCRTGIAILRAIDALPDDKADNFTAFLATSTAVTKP